MTLLALHPVHFLLLFFVVSFVLFNWRGQKP
jgi:hypothetical protein